MLVESNQTQLHPILRNDYAVYTVATDKFMKKVVSWTENMLPGAYVYGRPRIGKSRALKYWVEPSLHDYYGNQFCMYRMRIKNMQLPNENTFLDEVIQSLKGKLIKFTGKNIKSLKYELIVNHIIVDRIKSNAHISLFVIDEAQNLSESHFHWLCNIQNELDELGCNITFLLVGSQALNSLSELYSAANDAQIVGRFMLDKYQFTGVRTKDELSYVLNNYDQESEWPTGSENSFTEYFFTKSYQCGFRFVNHISMFWNCYTSEFESALSNKDKRIEVSMEHIGKAINFICRNYADIESEQFELSSNQILEAIKHTHFRHYMSQFF